jgi:hypothetical protein
LRLSGTIQDSGTEEKPLSGTISSDTPARLSVTPDAFINVTKDLKLDLKKDLGCMGWSPERKISVVWAGVQTVYSYSPTSPLTRYAT